jgi:hypothetical protein
MKVAEFMNYLELEKRLESNTYIVQAPPPTDLSILPSIYWIKLRNGQEVEWQWTELPDGNRVVTGYKIIQQDGR